MPGSAIQSLLIRMGSASVADDLHVDTRSGFGLASIMAHKGIEEATLTRALGTTFPATIGWRGDDRLALIGTGPSTWLAYTAVGTSVFASELASRLVGKASVSDQSSGYIIFVLKGPGARRLLQRGAPIDLHPSAFAPGSVATTVIAHIGAIIWQVDQEPTFHVAVFRSFSQSFRRWLETASAAL
ncbi:hypothetical protein BH10PLA2_BH10PLA2_01240 [soil metagenome]